MIKFLRESKLMTLHRSECRCGECRGATFEAVVGSQLGPMIQIFLRP
jgi:hypothetical protein